MQGGTFSAGNLSTTTVPLCEIVRFHIQSPCRRTVLQTDVRAEDVAWCNSLWLRPGAVCLRWAQFSYFFSFFLHAHRFHHFDGSWQYKSHSNAMWLHIPNNEIAHLKRSFQGPFTSSHSLFEIGLHLLFVRSANLFSKKALGLPTCSLGGDSKCLLSLFGFILSVDRTLLHSRHFGFSS